MTSVDTKVATRVVDGLCLYEEEGTFEDELIRLLIECYDGDVEAAFREPQKLMQHEKLTHSNPFGELRRRCAVIVTIVEEFFNGELGRFVIWVSMPQLYLTDPQKEILQKWVKFMAFLGQLPPPAR